MPSHPTDGGPFICSICGTDKREGRHGAIESSYDGNSVTFRCTFPRTSLLPRVVEYLPSPAFSAEYWYRAPAAPLSPREAQDAHRDEAFGRE